MPLINLIQEQRLAARKNEQQARFFFMAFAGSAALSVVALGFLTFLRESAESEQSSLRAKAQKLQPMLDEIAKHQAEYGKLAPRVTTLTDAQETTNRWNRVLAHLSTQTPTETWLTQMRASQPDLKQPVQISFIGLSSRQELIGEFILRMQGSPDLKDVGLKFSQEKNVQFGAQLEFEVSAGLDGTIEERERDETKKEGGSA
jgi:Tfp pilus assembly protein PilN